MYWSYRENGTSDTFFPLMIRVKSGDPTAVAAAVRAAIRKIDAGAAITRVTPMAQVISDSLGQPRFYLALLALFASVAMLLGVAGLYGVSPLDVRTWGWRPPRYSSPGSWLRWCRPIAPRVWIR